MNEPLRNHKSNGMHHSLKYFCGIKDSKLMAKKEYNGNYSNYKYLRCCNVLHKEANLTLCIVGLYEYRDKTSCVE